MPLRISLPILAGICHALGCFGRAMKDPLLRDDSTRFSGKLRHYHRTGAQNPRTWEEWVDGRTPGTTRKPWLKACAIFVGVIALGGIIAGLVIELA